MLSNSKTATFFNLGTIPKLLLLISNASLLLSGCQMFNRSADIYAANSKALGESRFEITVDTRIEQKGLSETIFIAQEVCTKIGKQRFIQTGQQNLYSHGQNSIYPTGYYRLITLIKCK